MTKDYFMWFLKHYREYEYFGEEALSIKRRLARMSERTIPPSPQESIEIYVAFYKHYNGDIFSSKSKYIDGIRAKKADFYIMFRSQDNTPIPLAYMAEHGAVAEGDIKDAIIAERDRKTKYYSDIIEYHSGVMDTTERLIDDIYDRYRPHATDTTTAGFFFCAILFTAILACLFIPEMQTMLGFEKAMIRYVAQGICGALLLLFTVLGFVAGKKYSYFANSRAIMYQMEDFKKRIQKNISKLRKYDSQQVRKAMRSSKPAKPIIKDTDYNIELRYFGTSLELIKLRLEESSSFAKVLFYITAVVASYAVGYLTLGIIQQQGGVGKGANYIFPLVPALLSALLCIKLVKKIRMRRLLLLFVLSIIAVFALAIINVA